MRRIAFAILAYAVAMSVGGCASHQSPGQVIEAADTAALSTYGTIGSLVDAYERGGGNVVTGEAIRVKAWDAMTVINNAYKAGQAINMAPLSAILTQAQGL